MGQTDRISQLKQWLDAGQCLSRQVLLQRLGVSWATVKRDLDCLRLYESAPIKLDRERGGYRLDAATQAPGTHYALSVSLRENEIHALLAMQHLLAHVEPGGVLGPRVAPMQRLLTQMLDKGLRAPVEVVRRIRVLSLGARKLDVPHFQTAAHAVLQRRRVRMRYRARGSGQTTDREVSPQRLVHYRENWVLDAWCHLHEGLRTFSVDAILDASVLDTAAIDVPDAELDDILGKGYGIFAGRDVRSACLRFTPERARWVASERWHPNQNGRFDADGHWLLTVPYADPRELVMDILRHVPEVEVLWPEELVEEVRRRLAEGLRRMGGAG